MGMLIRRLLTGMLVGLMVGAILVPVLLCEGSLRMTGHPEPHPLIAQAIASHSHAEWESVQATAADGVTLDGWLFTPHDANGAGVIVLHGVDDTRVGMSRHTAFLLDAGFTVLAPDLRGHGSSGGPLVTYGVREASDVHVWADVTVPKAARAATLWTWAIIRGCHFVAVAAQGIAIPSFGGRLPLRHL